MSPSVVSPFSELQVMTLDNASDQVTPQNVFEGPEKKLAISFQRFCDGRQKQSRAEVTAGLRSLARTDVQAILDAASCTVLSVTSNGVFDAYLLSESSLFIADLYLMIKTCGTTTLLKALPVVLKLALDKLNLGLVSVQFSRVAYLFPGEQVFPHDSFAHEVMYLDSVLHTTGNVFRAPNEVGSDWFLYAAAFENSNVSVADGECDHVVHSILSEKSVSPVVAHQTMEIFMFDLNPDIMERFMFHRRPDITGRDLPGSGTTLSTGIRHLVRENTIIDAFNFEPCGYSMNGLLHDTYYTIHVSPEPEGSYVSFETNATKSFLAQSVASVVRLFQPGRFTIALIDTSAVNAYSRDGRISWAVLRKLLHQPYTMDNSATSFDEHSNFGAEAASFTRVKSTAIDPTPILRHDLPFSEGEYQKSLTTVAAKYNASVVVRSGELGFVKSDKCFALGPELRHPEFVIDLEGIARNIHNIRFVIGDNRVRLRYAVRCNADEAILSLLAKLDVQFEAASDCEVQLIRKLGAPKSNVILVTPVMTASIRKVFEQVSTVAIFQKPCEALADALQVSNVGVEIRVRPDNINKLPSVIAEVLKIGKRIGSVAIDNGIKPVKAIKSHNPSVIVAYANQIEQCLKVLPDKMRSEVDIMIGGVHGDNARHSPIASKVSYIRGVLSGLSTSIAVDVSQLIVQDCVSLIISVIGRRRRQVPANTLNRTKAAVSYSYYMNDGIYGAFGSVVMHSGTQPRWSHFVPHVVRASQKMSPGKRDAPCDAVPTGREEYLSTLFGPTCDALDRIWVGPLPILDVGDLVVFSDMGAYAVSTGCTFNGFGRRFDTSYCVSTEDRSQ